MNSINRGVTLIEVTIASAILAVILVMCLEFMATATDLYGDDMARLDLEIKLQTQLDRIILELKETSPDKLQIYDFNDGPDNINQTIIIFPTARPLDSKAKVGDFTYMDGGKVQKEPVWQGIIVYAFYTEDKTKPGYLVRYSDYSNRNYTNTIGVKSVTDDYITLTDNTKFARDDHHDSGKVGNQFNQQLMGDFLQLVRVPEPPAAISQPLVLKLVGQKVVDEATGANIMAESSTGVMSRNKN